jgi:hypothetical protein
VEVVGKQEYDANASSATSKASSGVTDVETYAIGNREGTGDMCSSLPQSLDEIVVVDWSTLTILAENVGRW